MAQLPLTSDGVRELPTEQRTKITDEEEVPVANSRVQPPQWAPTIPKNRKRLIVLCDGTWQDSTDHSASQYPSNVSRLARALSPNAYVTRRQRRGRDEFEEIQQIVYYQKGVGTGTGDKLLGGASGAGLSANIRSAYGFLASNYDEGDTIYIFGFSRGAYTARSLASLVVSMGLLTKRGMDNFAILYEAYYNRNEMFYDSNTDSLKKSISDALKRAGQLISLPRGTVEIVGVWDTVAFYAPLPGTGGEYEFHSNLLSDQYKYAFHALSLDESRWSFSPTLWFKETKNTYTDLQQVWFSGAHSDVGGGMEDPRLSDITLAWMIAQCSKHNQLSFDMSYLKRPEDRPQRLLGGEQKWATCLGANSWFGEGVPILGCAIGKSVVNQLTATSAAVTTLSNQRVLLAYYRTPGRYNLYNTIGVQQHLVTANETLHASIHDRAWVGAPRGGSVSWPCPALEQFSDMQLLLAPLLDLEVKLKNQIRSARSDVRKDFDTSRWELNKIVPGGPKIAIGGLV